MIMRRQATIRYCYMPRVCVPCICQSCRKANKSHWTLCLWWYISHPWNNDLKNAKWRSRLVRHYSSDQLVVDCQIAEKKNFINLESCPAIYSFNLQQENPNNDIPLILRIFLNQFTISFTRSRHLSASHIVSRYLMILLICR